MEKTCSNCHYWGGNHTRMPQAKSAKLEACRKNAPQPRVVTTDSFAPNPMYAFTIWPLTRSYEWCGEYEKSES